MMSNIQPVVTRWKNTIQKKKTYDVLSMYKERPVMVQKYSEKATSSKKKKGRKKKKKKKKKKKGRRQLLGNCVWLSGRMNIEERFIVPTDVEGVRVGSRGWGGGGFHEVMILPGEE